MSKFRVIALNAINRYSKRTGTRRGFGTGSGRRKGTQLEVNARVRELLHTVKAGVDAELNREELARYVAALYLIEPDTFNEAVKRYRRVGGSAVIPVIPARNLIRPETLRPPTINELCKHTKLNPDTVRLFRKERPELYQQWLAEIMISRASPGELAIFRAIRHDAIRKAADFLACYRYIRLSLTGKLMVFKHSEPAPEPKSKPTKPSKPRDQHEPEPDPNVDALFAFPRMFRDPYADND